MVFIRDEGALFEAPIDTVWKYLRSDSHGKAHAHIRNAKSERISDTSFVFSSERNRHGNWTKEAAHVTDFEPLGVAFEMIGPHKGSKMFYVYTPKGEKTQIDVYGAFTSDVIPDERLEREVLEELEGEFNDDATMIKSIAKKN
jgi:hypothetical protein